VEKAHVARYRVHKWASECGVSPRQLQRRVRKQTGHSARSWLNILRQKRGFLLISNGSTLKETAWALGYLHVTHFSRDFKRYYGVSPSQVQKDFR
jgi:AraC-like DNA-binding protein